MKSTASNDRSDRFSKSISVFRKQGGILRTAQALRAGIHPSTLYALRDSGRLEIVSRGVFRLAEGAPLSNPDLVAVASRIPRGVICLISALAFHELTTQIPHEVFLALPRGTEEPRLEYPPLRTFRFSQPSYSKGVDVHKIGSVRVRVFNPEKTIADCFKFRRIVGLDSVLEAVRLYRDRKRINVDALMRYAEICRVTNVIRPYIEALL
jgi:predicted transcriptional regulator of viral defense system